MPIAIEGTDSFFLGKSMMEAHFGFKKSLGANSWCELGPLMSFLGREVGISNPSVSESLTRSQQIAEAIGCRLIET